jgi:hypothetical protein
MRGGSPKPEGANASQGMTPPIPAPAAEKGAAMAEPTPAVEPAAGEVPTSAPTPTPSSSAASVQAGKTTIKVPLPVVKPTSPGATQTGSPNKKPSDEELMSGRR